MNPTKPIDVRIGDRIRGFGTVTQRFDVNGRGRDGRLIRGPFFATDTGYHALNFGETSVPVESR